MMHNSERPGYLSMNGQPIPEEEIARYCGVNSSDYLALLGELFRHNVPRKTPSGIIFSHRMVADYKKRREWRKRQNKVRLKEKCGLGTRDVTRDVTRMSRPSSSSSSSSIQNQIQMPFAKAANESPPPVENGQKPGKSAALMRIAGHLDYRKEQHDREAVEARMRREAGLPQQWMRGDPRLDPKMADILRDLARGKSL